MNYAPIALKLPPLPTMQATEESIKASQGSDEILKNDGFFPDLDCSEFRQEARLDGTITPPRLKDCLIEATATANDELNQFKKNCLLNNITQLEQLNAQTLGGENILNYRYKRAVFCLALANLYERYSSYDTTAEGNKKTDPLQNSINQLKRDARYALRDIKGQHRINVELI